MEKLRTSGAYRFFLDSPDEVFAEVRRLCEYMAPDIDSSLLQQIVDDAVRLYEGQFPGRRENKTAYHNLGHALSVMLAAARILHGAFVEGRRVSENMILLTLICAVFHDTGTGAEHTIGYEARSVEFVRNYIENYVNELPTPFVDLVPWVIEFTRLGSDTDSSEMPDGETLFCARVVGTADVLAQIADRLYLEKLLLLYKEFREAGMNAFESEDELIRQNQEFVHSVIANRLPGPLGGVAGYLRSHFQVRTGQDRNYYMESVERNLAYLRRILASVPTGYRRLLRRSLRAS
jgi:hypothetical protein